MTQQIGIKDLRFIANKVKDEADEKFIREALSGHEILEFIPYSEDIRKADRIGQSALDALPPEIAVRFENILKKLS